MYSEITRTDGGKLAYYHWPGEGPSLLLIPGSWSDYRQFDKLRSYLSPSLDLVIVELPGHGQSWPPIRSGSIEDLAREVLRVPNKLGWKSWYVGGHSIGGMVAVELGGCRSQEVVGIISIEGWTHHEVLMEAFTGLLYETLTPSQEKQRQEERTEGMSRLSEEERSVFSNLWKQWDGEPILKTTTVRVLELWGDRNRTRPGRHALRIPDRENIELHWVEGASHALPLDRPKQVADAVNRFVLSGE